MFHPQGPTFWELAQQALSSTQRGYDLLAPKFDLTPFRTPDWLLQAAVPFLATSLPPGDGLDLCCGTGAATRTLADLCQRRVVGIDFSEKMLEVARQQSASDAEKRIEFVRGDVLEMSFDEDFDLAVCFGALGHILPRDQRRFAEQVARALRTGGRFVFATSYLPPRWSRRYWASRGFNAAMRVRNGLIRPPFIMYYLTFLVPEAITALEQAGFRVEVHTGITPVQCPEACLVVGTKN